MQPAPQSMGTFPTSHAKTASFFLEADVQIMYAFIPDNGSVTFVVNIEVIFFLYVFIEIDELRDFHLYRNAILVSFLPFYFEYLSLTRP
jgi:hypothetical protein